MSKRTSRIPVVMSKGDAGESVPALIDQAAVLTLAVASQTEAPA